MRAATPFAPAVTHPGEKLDHAYTSMIENLRIAMAEPPQAAGFSGDTHVLLVHCCDDEVNLSFMPP